MGKKFDSIKDAKLWIMSVDTNIKEYMFKNTFTKYINNNTGEDDFYGFVCKYYSPNINDDDIWISINTLNGKVFSPKTNTTNDYNFNDIEDIYQVSKYGKYRNKNGIVYDLPLVNITTIKKQFGSYCNISLFYLLAIAFAKNPNNYYIAELRENGKKTTTFFKNFDAERDIVWIPSPHQKNEKEFQDNMNDYKLVFIDGPTFEFKPKKEKEKQIEEKIEEQYDSIKDSILEDTWTELEKYPGYEIDARGHVRNKRTLKLLKSSIGSTGYYHLNNYGLIHRLVAITFIPNLDKITKITVNHIDGNKLNNNISNLEWASYKDQNIHMGKLHPNRDIIPDRKQVSGQLNNDSLEKLIKYQLFIVNNILIGVDIDNIKKVVYINKNIYKSNLEFNCVSFANEYFENLGFPESNSLSYNIGINKDTYGYTWKYIEEENINKEEWKIISDIKCEYYDLSHCTNYEVSSHGRFRKDGKKITDPSTFKPDNRSIHLGSKKELKVNIIVACAFIEDLSMEKTVYHIDGNKQNYHYTNLCWKSMGELVKIGHSNK
jgi:hypothetical protein